MPKLIAITALAAAIAGAAAPVSAQKPADVHVAQHGGVFVAGKEADYELVARPDRIRLYVNDHGKPMDVSNASAKLTLLNGADKQEVELKPAAGLLQAQGMFTVGPATKAVAVVTKDGKTLGVARFALK